MPDRYEITAQARDEWGITGISKPVHVTIGSAAADRAPAVGIRFWAHDTRPGSAYSADVHVFVQDPDSYSGPVELLINGVVVAAATNAVFNTFDPQLCYSIGLLPGSYTLSGRATDSWGITGVFETNVIMHRTPLFVSQPADQTTEEGGTAQFRVQLSAYPAASFQWRSNGVDIAGATNAVLELDDVSLDAYGSGFYVVASNEFGRAISATAVLRLNLYRQRATVSLMNDRPGREIRTLDGRFVSTNEAYAEVWGGDLDRPLEPLPNRAGEMQFPLQQPGMFSGGAAILPGVEPGQIARFQVRAWQGSPKFDTAPLRGISPVFTQPTGILYPTPTNATISLHLPDAVFLQPPTPWPTFSHTPPTHAELTTIVTVKSVAHSGVDLTVDGLPGSPVQLE